MSSLLKGGPALFALDLNALPEHIPFCATLLGPARWVDLGAVASHFGGTDYAPTCLAPNSKQATQRDYLFALHSVGIRDDGTFATHARLSATFRLNMDPFP